MVSLEKLNDFNHSALFICLGPLVVDAYAAADSHAVTQIIIITVNVHGNIY